MGYLPEVCRAYISLVLQTSAPSRGALMLLGGLGTSAITPMPIETPMSLRAASILDSTACESLL